MEFEKITTDVKLSEDAKRVMDKMQKIVARKTYDDAAKIESILNVILDENPDLHPTDCILELDTDHNPIAIYKKVKIYDFKEDQ